MIPNKITLTNDLIQFLNASPTVFHAVEQGKKNLIEAGFIELEEGDSWNLERGKRYVVIRNDSSLIAFNHQPEAALKQGIKLLGAHSDSPCLKLKPNAEIHTHGYFQLGVEVYGGALLNPWFDRDLSVAGRVSYIDRANELQSTLINFIKPIAIIPSLAIHLEPNANQGKGINPQQHIKPILMHSSDAQICFEDLLTEQLHQQEIKDVEKILDWELFLYDTQAANCIGYHQEFIASARLDNLLSCFVSMQALIDSTSDMPAMMIWNDHEEVGSLSHCGADGPFLTDCLQRIFPDTEQRTVCLNHSLLLSLDNAHGVHPNFPDKHDSHHQPILNGGPVIKYNANQRYATNSCTSAVLKKLCYDHKLPLQEFVSRNDVRCGSTLGPITAAKTGIRTLDLGAATFAMHSIRELAGSKDLQIFYQMLRLLLESNSNVKAVA